MRGVEGVAQQRVQARRSIRVALPRFYFAGILSVLGGLLLWELVSRFLVANALFLAAPSQIFTAIAALAKTGELWRHISVRHTSLRLQDRLRRRPSMSEAANLLAWRHFVVNSYIHVVAKRPSSKRPFRREMPPQNWCFCERDHMLLTAPPLHFPPSHRR
jgi:hypothetical protein